MSCLKSGLAMASLIVMVISVNIQAQSVVVAGPGSYASEPPSHETFNMWWADSIVSIHNFATNSNLYTAVGEQRPIPTNDWWSDILVKQYGGGLWAYPYYGETHNQGMTFFFPQVWNHNGTDMHKETPLVVKGEGFAPTSSLAQDWNDWGLKIRMPQGAQHLDFTLAHGVPMVWIESQGVVPQIDALEGHFFDAQNNAVNFPYTGGSLRFEMHGKHYGVFAPEGTRYEKLGNQITLRLPAAKQFFSLGFMDQAGSFELFKQHAFVIPRDTRVEWNYNPAQSKVEVNWSLFTANLNGDSEDRVIQGFIPHHYKRVLQAPTLNGPQYSVPRGQMRSAVGRQFTFEYKLPGILPYYPAPEMDASQATPYNPTTLESILSSRNINEGLAGDTYWGGKAMLSWAKYALTADVVNSPLQQNLMNKIKAEITNWLSYTPGETSKYYAWYPQWKALIGFDESYGSYAFTDNHFHYSYLIHAAALVGISDPQFVRDYQQILTMIVKQYANWDRNSTQFPFLRTMDPWMGHSYAGGLGSGGGNNQESTSEAMQSWVAMFLLGNILGDNEMVATGAFGYISEARATMEYWFDWDEENLSDNYEHTMVGILWNGGAVYGTYFSADPHHIHGIQYLPAMPGLSYLGWNPQWAASEYQVMMSESQTVKGYTDELQMGNDWANVNLGFRMMFDPAYVTAKYESWVSQNHAASREANSAFIYHGAHFLQNQGAMNWEFTLSLPSSQVFYNDHTKEYRFWAYNYSETPVICYVLGDQGVYDQFEVPGRSYALHTWSDVPTPNSISKVPVLKPEGQQRRNIKGERLNSSNQWILGY
jgi:endoglucanase Acf2